MWTEGLEKQVVDDLVSETPAQQESLRDKVDALRTWWRNEAGGLARAMGKTDQFDCTSANEVLRGKLYIGCEIASSKIAQTHPQIKAVVSLHSQGPTKCGYRRFDGIKYHHVIIEDDANANLFQHLDECCDFIHQHDGPVFVHCQAGVSRSASICMAYLIKYGRMTVDQAFAVVYCARPIIWPNSGFVHQLKYFENKQ